MPARDGQMQELSGSAPLPGKCLPARKEAQQNARGWRPPSPPRRRRGGSLPPQDTLPEALETEEGEVGVEKDYEPEPSAMEE